MAKRLGVSLRTLSSYENGETEPRGKRRERLESALRDLMANGNLVQEAAVDYRVSKSLTKSEQALASSFIPFRVEEYERQLQTIRNMLDDVIQEGIHYEKTDGGGRRLFPQGARKLLTVLGMTSVETGVDFDKLIDGGYVVVLRGSLRRSGSDEDITRSTGISSTSEFNPAEGADLMSVASTLCFRRASDRLLINLILAGTAAGEVFEP